MSFIHPLHKEHYLLFLYNTPYFDQKAVCKVCNTNMVNEVFYHCDACYSVGNTWDCCFACAQKESLVHPHTMVRNYPDPCPAYKCSRCNKEFVEGSEVCFLCEQCDYYNCASCFVCCQESPLTVKKQTISSNSQNTGQVPTSQLEQFTKTFQLLDKDNNTTISTVEVNNILKLFGVAATKQDLTQIVNEVGGSGGISLNNFLNFMSKNINMSDSSANETKVLQVVFQAIIGPEGKITHSTLKQALNLLGANLTDEEVEILIEGVDSDGDQKLNINDFAKLLS